ncbi:hypothetical protein PQI07_27975 [Methylobacterium sp. 092160098-2]|uniref:hypothetical protein n=1 Tax=Methylobacterium sp. 092160098-2 TaxID=3025129 RepID=UPI002381B415|nr:hypothetical protein [Methylobacterium sp. 092160098-2]MDE4914507.1 hypothetical protein [Methylobacterium sp. 092160098-2]
MTTPRAGRPIGSGLDDEAALDAIEALLADLPGLSKRSAIVQIAGDEGADIRRLQRKLGHRAEARAGDARRLLAQPFEHGEVRRGRLWFWTVEVPTSDPRPLVVGMAVAFGMPVLEILLAETEFPVPPEERPDHPVFLAIRKLPRGYDWDDPSYRLCCERLGVDPDRGRPPHFDTQAAAAAAVFKRKVRAEGETYHQLLEDGMAFETTERGTYNPQRLSALHKRCAGSSDPAERHAAEEALQAFGAVDWTRASAFTDLLWLSGPWGFDHRASVHLFGTERDGVSSWSDKPEFIAPIPEDDLVARRAALAVERNCMAIVLSEEEMADYIAGGDRLHWFTVRNWYTSPWGRLRAIATAPDLGMTRRLVDAMVRSACEGYVSRRNGDSLRPDTLLSCERRDPIAPSKRLPLFRNVARRIAGEWRDARARRRGARGNCWPAVADGRLHLPWGVCLIGRDRGRIIVRPGAHPLRYDGRSVRLAVDLIEGFGRHIPDVAASSFELIDLDTGKAIDLEDMIGILDLVSSAGALLPRTETAAVPTRHRLGWAAAGFAACLMLLASLNVSDNGASRAQATTMPTDLPPLQSGPVAPPLD